MVDYHQPQRALTPILDIADWRTGADKAAVARDFDRICREIGFFYLTGHGISPATMQSMLEQSARFFALDESIKRSLHVDWRRRGYEPFGLQSLDATVPPDIKESLLIGLDQPDDHPYVRRRLANYGRNNWPSEEQLPGFRSFCEDYFSQVYGVGRTLMAIFATVAGLPEDHFEPILVDPMATLRLIHYPPQPGAVVDNQIGCGTHTDWGAVTLLLQDDTGGLEVEDSSGEWLYANPLPGAYVVNIGDMMPVWTNGAYHSNPHRVRNADPHRHRYSVPLFIDPDYDAKVSCLDAFLPLDGTPALPPRTVGEHIDLMYAISYGHDAAGHDTELRS
ncbi:2OG-Fe(II) oxygenase family protein [Telmatospirillum sp.]|uniref:isopenicillin N synthase family dioxygenase n=1 Tax=Telmatospirillum sp. TaxID=2079197 RepID=UPI00284CF1F3|nr:2OG-Fe(II) oxygenase family protein [Telmatospirillum sp.]MDR3436183.1 2-oxoglutarate and iron-dependent oxygenase domain-containing protein [Telmatospirillum sp.]